MHIHTDTHIHQTLSVLRKFLYVILSLVCILYTTNVRAQARTVGLSFCVLQFKLVCRNILLQTHKLTHTRGSFKGRNLSLQELVLKEKERKIILTIYKSYHDSTNFRSVCIIIRISVSDICGAILITRSFDD